MERNFKSNKRLCITANVVFALLFVIEIWSGQTNLNSCFALGFATWLSIGSWYMFDDSEKGRKAELHTAYLWPLRFYRPKEQH